MLQMPQRARVTAVYRDRCLLLFPDGERSAEVTGRFRYEASSHADFPAVGDWVLASVVNGNSAVIHALLPRTTTLSRKAAGDRIEEQVLAANVDVAFIVTSFNEDFNVRRLERYLAVVRQAHVATAVLINKSDLAGPDDKRISEAAHVASGAPIFRVSAKTGDGIAEVVAFLGAGRTAVLHGSSGVGKSSILNRILGTDTQAVAEIRHSDARGRHTTTVRQIFETPGQGFLIDTPGLREIGLWIDDDAVAEVYADVSRLAEGCRFRNCSHQGETGCAVAPALASGELDAGRWAGYLKMQKEIDYLRRRRDPELEAKNRKHWKRIHKSYRQFKKKNPT